MKIVIGAELSREDFYRFRDRWNDARTIAIEISQSLRAEEVISLCRVLEEFLPDPFACAVFADLNEQYAIPFDVLEGVFDKADVGLQVSICLRDTLSQALAAKCAASKHPEVVEHFRQRRLTRE